MKTILAVIGVLAVLFVLTMMAVCNGDNDDAWRPVLVSHDCEWEGDCGGQDYDENYGSRDDRNRNRDRNRGAFSPGPFDRSPIDFSGSCISLNCSGRDDRRRQEEER